MKKNESSLTLTRIGQLRVKETAFRVSSEETIRQQLAIQGAAIHQELAEAIRYAIDHDGASWASVKRAYGTTNHETVKALYAEAGAGVLATIDNPDVVFEFEAPAQGRPEMVHLTSYVNDAGKQIETDLYVVNMGEDGFLPMGAYPEDIGWDKIQEAFRERG